MRLPRNVSPAAAARRTWLFDVALGVLVGVVAIVLAAGIGVVAFFALLAAIALVASYLLEGALRRRERRDRRREASG